MESYLNLSRGAVVELKRELCSSRLNMHARGAAIVSSGHQVQFYADQVRGLGGGGGGAGIERRGAAEKNGRMSLRVFYRRLWNGGLD